MANEHRRPALTRIGEDFNRRVFFRRAANCPAVLIYRFRRLMPFAQADAWISNISEGSALLLVDGLSEAVEDAYVVLPGLMAKIHGKVVRQGEFTIALEFETLLPPVLVERIAALEPVEGARPRLSRALGHAGAARKKSSPAS